MNSLLSSLTRTYTNYLPEVSDKNNFTQNMQGMIKGDHKRKLTKEEKRMKRQTHFSDLADNEVPPSNQDDHPQTLRTQKKSARSISA
jgi:hypothetical protein